MNTIKLYRKSHGMTIEDVAEFLDISPTLVNILEEGGVTHPKIAKRIGRLLGLGWQETEELMPENRRPHSPNYDPLKYMEKNERIVIKVDRLLKSKKPTFSISEVSDALELAEDYLKAMIAAGWASMNENGRLDAEQVKSQIIRQRNQIVANSLAQSPTYFSSSIYDEPLRQEYDICVQEALHMIQKY